MFARWPATLPPGRYTATVAVFDDGCPLNADEEQTFSFLVSAPGTTLADRPALPPASGAACLMPFCEQVQLQAAGGQAVTITEELERVEARLQAGADGRVRWQMAPTLPAGRYVARGAAGRLLCNSNQASANAKKPALHEQRRLYRCLSLALQREAQTREVIRAAVAKLVGVVDEAAAVGVVQRRSIAQGGVDREIIRVVAGVHDKLVGIHVE